MRTRLPLLLFAVFSVLEIFSHTLGNSFLHHLAKPLIMPALGWYYLVSVKWNTSTALVLVAIVFSFLGDTFLMYDSLDQLYFMLGLGSFLLAHVFYAIAYGRHVFDLADSPLANVQMIRMATPVILAGTGLVVILYPVLGDLRAPVIVYALVLMFMVLKALFRYHKTSTTSFFMVFAGAVLFMISDSLLAINKFLQPIAGSAFLIMGTYITAQLLIIEGLIRHGEAKLPHDQN
jgi:uncharacterized membrane protein YhhN